MAALRAPGDVSVAWTEEEEEENSGLPCPLYHRYMYNRPFSLVRLGTRLTQTSLIPRLYRCTKYFVQQPEEVGHENISDGAGFYCARTRYSPVALNQSFNLIGWLSTCDYTQTPAICQPM